ncbi:MAG: NADH-quinone oxidoreductase subunit N [Bacteroidia bacterium]
MNTLIYTACLGLFGLLAEIFNLRKYLIPILVLGLAVIFSLNLQTWNNPQTHFNGMLSDSNFSTAFSGLALFIMLIILILSGDFYTSTDDEKHISDYMAILMFTLCGALMMFSFSNMAMLFLGIETLSISLYVMAGSRRFELKSNEAGFKYFLMGSFASAFLLFGIALVFGVTGTFSIDGIGNYMRMHADKLDPLFIVGMLLMIFAMLFKVSAAPFHFWAPDVYEGAPSLITALMSTLVKIAAFAAFYRLLSSCFVFALGKAEIILTISCAATLLVGSLVALVQDNFKRLLAYSGISHAGYMMLAIISIQGSTDSALFLYSVGYAVASLAAFAIAITVFKSTGTESISGFNGLAKKNPLLAASLTMAMLSLAGIPPFAGFFGKYFIFSEAFRNGWQNMVFVAIISSIIGVFYYMKVIVAMYSKPANEFEIKPTFAYQMVIAVCLIISIVLGLYPGVFTKLL